MMDEPRETELKFDLAPGDVARFRALPLLGEPASTRELRSRYFDTLEHDLQAQGLSLRVRSQDGGFVQTVKAAGRAGSGLFDRPEWESPIAGDEPDLGPAAKTPLARLLSEEGIGDGLVAVFETHVRRSEWSREMGNAQIVVTLDEGEVRSEAGSARICEVELELKTGPPNSLFALAREIDDEVPLRLGILSKAERGYALGTRSEIYAAGPVLLDESMSAGAGFQAIARSCIRHFRLNEDVLAASRSVEALHQTRVALRRLRSALSIFKLILGDERRTRGAALRPLAEALGQARNLDVFLERVTRPENEQSPDVPGLASLIADLETRREAAYARVLTELAATQTRRAMIELAAWIECGAWLDAPELQQMREQPLAAFARDLFAARRRWLKRRGRHLARLSPPERHHIRVASKKLRYAIEFLAALFGSRRKRRLSRFRQRLVDLQEVLGDLNDLETGQALATELAQPNAKADFAVIDLEPFAAGILVGCQAEREAELVDRASAAHRRFRKAKRFWR